MLRTFLAGAALLLITAASANAADLMYISEYTGPGIYRGYNVEIGQEASFDQVTSDFTAGAVQSSAFQANTTVVRLICTVQCSVLFGTNPTATNANKVLPALLPEYFSVPAGGTFKVSVHTNP